MDARWLKLETSADGTQVRALGNVGKTRFCVAVVQAYEGADKGPRDGARLGWGMLSLASTGSRAEWFAERADAAALAAAHLFDILKG